MTTSTPPESLTSRPDPAVNPDSSSSAAEPAHGAKREGRFVGATLRRPPPSQQPSSLVPVAKAPTNPTRRFTPVPDSLLHDESLLADLTALPANYSFELPKTIHRLREARSTRVALQLPEGLLMFATTLSDIITRHTQVHSTVILADVTYGACCVDDLSASALHCDFLVHYGHSCLVSVITTLLPSLYVFVHIAFDASHLSKTLVHNLDPEQRIALIATIQFVDTAHDVCDSLRTQLPNLFVPQKRPLSRGEVLGCTAPTIPDADVLVYVGDGRFHLESAMIANPNLRALRYDPYSKQLTDERYLHDEMITLRQAAISAAKDATNFGVILGTLGRQGSPALLHRVTTALRQFQKRYFVVLLSEISPPKLARFETAGVHAWVQVACPRLSVDWGHSFSSKPLLTPYECFVALGKVQWRDVYPMDYYAKDGGEWTNYFKPSGEQRGRQRRSPGVLK